MAHENVNRLKLMSSWSVPYFDTIKKINKVNTNWERGSQKCNKMKRNKSEWNGYKVFGHISSRYFATFAVKLITTVAIYVTMTKSQEMWIFSVFRLFSPSKSWTIHKHQRLFNLVQRIIEICVNWFSLSSKGREVPAVLRCDCRFRSHFQFAFNFSSFSEIQIWDHRLEVPNESRKY